jgi:integrase
MATLRKLATGNWQAQIRRKGLKPVVKTFKSKQDAEQWARLIESEIDKGMFQDRSAAENTTVSEIIDRYLEEVTPTKKSAKSEIYRLKFIKTHLGAFSLARLQNKHITAYRDSRLNAGVTGSTVTRELCILSHVLDTAIKDWSFPLSTNPVKFIRRPALSKSRERRLGPQEEEKLIKACQCSGSPFLYPLVILALETGMRQGELFKLEWHNIDLSNRVATLPDTKNGETRRVPLSSKAVEILRKTSRQLGNNRVFWCWNSQDSLKIAWQRMLKKEGFENLHFHDLRHEATSRFFERGLDMIEVATITGHKTLQMLKRYTHLKAEHLALKLG